MSDLWRYHIASNEWTWMGGPTRANQPGVFGNLYQASSSSIPPPRNEANAGWTDANNNLWLFGGDTLDGFYNDMWRYNIATAQWAWMGGSQQLNDAGNYGALGIESSGSLPPSRSSYTHWSNGDYLYLTSGNNDSSYVFNDVWRFNLNTNYWAWVGGDSDNVTLGQYSQYCSGTNGDMPRGRYEERSAQINGCSPLMFMWGGRGANGYLNDLWNFDPASNTWRWVSGSAGNSPVGYFGIKGVSNPANVPTGAMGSCFWSDNAGNLWLFGGTSGIGLLNAMWKYTPDASCLPVDTGSGNLTYQLSATNLCPGDSAIITFSGDSGISISPGNHVTWLDSLRAVIKADTTTVFTVSGYSACGSFSSQNFTLTIGTRLHHYHSK